MKAPNYKTDQRVNGIPGVRTTEPTTGGVSNGHQVFHSGKIQADKSIKIYYADHWRYFGSFEKHEYSDTVRPPNED